MRLTRRHLLASGAFVASASLASAAAVAVRWWDQDAAAPYRFLSADEVQFLDAVAELVFPAGGSPTLGGREAQVGRFLDFVYAGIPETQRNLLRLSFHAVDALPLATHGTQFHALAPPDAEALFREWLQHPRAELRGIAQSLHIFVGMAYLTHPDVAPTVSAFFTCGWGR